MDRTLLYATEQAIEATPNKGEYSDVAESYRYFLRKHVEGSGALYSEGYDESGGW